MHYCFYSKPHFTIPFLVSCMMTFISQREILLDSDQRIGRMVHKTFAINGVTLTPQVFSFVQDVRHRAESTTCARKRNLE